MQLNNTTNISDDQELAQALAGVNKEMMQFDEAGSTPTSAPAPEAPQEAEATEDVVDVQEALAPAPTPAAPAPVADEPLPNRSGLDDVKLSAIKELRPLIERLTLPPEEKFDTYLLLIRTTDDKSLVSPAHQTARQIEDESRRAMALLEIIKEIDYLSSKTK